MQKLMKPLCLVMSVLMVIACFAACGKQSGGETEPAPAVEDSTAAPDTEATESTTEAQEPESVSRPAADGRLVEAYDLTFYLPESLAANEWNGMLGVYDFYTGQYAGSSPSGIDISLTVSADSKVEGTLAEYAREQTKQRTGADVIPEEVDFNGFTWLRCKAADGSIDYYAIYEAGLYEIVTVVGGDTQENYDAAIAMMEQTLFLSPAE